MGEWTLKSSQRWLPGKKGRKGMDGRREGGREGGKRITDDQETVKLPAVSMTSSTSVVTPISE